MDMEKTGNYIKEKRELEGWSQEQFAEEVGVSTKAIGDWENARREIKLNNAVKVAEVLEVELTELAAGKDKEQIDSKDMEEFDKWIKELTRVSFGLEDRSITALDIAASAFGTALIAVAMAMWAAFGDGWISGIVCLLLGLFGVVFIKIGKKIINTMNENMEERKEKSSMS